VIIPVLNEAAQLPNTLAAVQSVSTVEIIVVDGGSQDGTPTLAASLAVQVVKSAPGRARQMNTGAAIAQGTVLLFLHGDTVLPPDYEHLVKQTLEQPGVIAGAFELAIDSPQWGLRLVEWGVRWRSRWLGLPYGDQAIFLKADRFHRIGGFPDLPIMEDVVLVQRLKALGKIAIAPAAVLTSDRRWQRLGILKTTLVNQLILLGYGCKIPPPTLARWYRQMR
jgi:rSAM/selenodomain-associated transferase 2